MNVTDHPDLEQMRPFLARDVANTLGRIGENHVITLHDSPALVSDASLKLAAVSPSGKRIAFILVSPRCDPTQIARAMRLAANIKEILGDRLGDAILTPLAEGHVLGLSYAILPHCQPLRPERRYLWRHRHLLRKAFILWLRNITQATAQPITSEENIELFEKTLAHIESSPHVATPLRREANIAMRSLDRQLWRPRVVMAHCDLWLGNLMINPRYRRLHPSCGYPFVVIDWGGGMLRGHPFFDLIRYAESTRFSTRHFKNEIKWHAHFLQCKPRESMAYLMAGLGQQGLHLGAFPVNEFSTMANSCHACLDHVLTD